MPRQNSYTQRGIPIVTDTPTMGNSFYVGNSTNRTDGITATDDTQTHGFSPQRPFSTVDFATNQCVAGRGDKVYILEGHAETLSAVTTWAPDVADVSYIGCGNMGNRPNFTLTQGSTYVAPNLSLTGDGTRFTNLTFTAGVATTGTSSNAICITANDVTIDHCDFTSNSSVQYFGKACIRVNNSSATAYRRITIDNNIFRNDGTSDNDSISIELASTGAITYHTSITNNLFTGYWRTAVINVPAACSFKGVLIADNVIRQGSTISTTLVGNAINILTTGIAATPYGELGMLANNSIQSASSGPSSIIFYPGAFGSVNNFVKGSTGGFPAAEWAVSC
jgi:hypothetical protein